MNRTKTCICIECGEVIERISGDLPKKLHVECAIARSARYTRAVSEFARGWQLDNTHPNARREDS